MNEDNLRLILDEAHNGRFNMAADELLLKNQIQEKSKNAVLRFYRFSEPTLTIGYGVWKSVIPSPLSGGRLGWGDNPPSLSSPTRGEEMIPRVRRITGGGIVSHKTSDLTYAFIAPYASFLSLRKTRGSYLFIHEALKRALVDFGVRTSFYENCAGEKGKSNYCFEAPVLYDVMLGEKKVAGAGQKRTLGYLLHQGSIAWDLLIQEQPKLPEVDFCRSFAKHLAKALNLSINETSFRAEELRELEVTPA